MPFSYANMQLTAARGFNSQRVPLGAARVAPSPASPVPPRRHRHVAAAAASPVGSSGLPTAPCPPQGPLLGHALPMAQFTMAGGNIEDLLLKWAREVGPYYVFTIPGNPPVLVVSDPDAVKEVYEIRQYAKSPRYADLLPLLGAQSMVVTEGSVWRAQRDAFNPGFSSSFLKSALPSFIGCTNNLMEALGKAADGKQTVLMHELAIMTTVEVICKVGFGEDAAVFSRGLADPLWSSFRSLGEHVAWFLDNIPFNWMKALPWNTSKAARLQQQLDDHLLDVLRQRLAAAGISEADLEGRSASTLAAGGADSAAAAAAGCPMHSAVAADGAAAAAAAADTPSSSSSGGAAEECPFHTAGDSRAASPIPSSSSSSSSLDPSSLFGDTKDILSLALKLSVKDGALDREQLLSQMKTFYAAGHDTTASLIAWAVYYLCQHPAALKRLVAEVDRGLGGPGGKEPSYQQLADMKYLNCVLKETLRVRPPVGVLARWAPEGTTLGGYDTSNHVVLVSPYILHVDPAVWGADAAEWRPERWEDEQGVAANVPAYSYMPFSRGPRDCIGSRFALLEAKTIMSMLYAQFDVEYVGQGEKVMMSVTAHPKYGVPVQVKRRQQAQAPAQQVPVAASVGSS